MTDSFSNQTALPSKIQVDLVDYTQRRFFLAGPQRKGGEDPSDGYTHLSELRAEVKILSRMQNTDVTQAFGH